MMNYTETMKYWLTLFSLLTLLVCCNKERDQLIGKGATDKTFEVDNSVRDYILYLPEGLDKNAPLVFVCHGYTGTARGIMEYSVMNEIADSNGFAVCYPQGTKDGSGKNFWQVGYEFNEQDTVDDVRFITQLAIKLQKDYKLSKENTFITGMSNGGDMCNLLAASSTEIFKAAAPVVGCMMKWFIDTYPDPNPIPMLLMNGTADNITLWAGDLANQYEWGPYHPTEDMFDYWIQANNCIEVEKKLVPNLNSEDGSHVILEKHSGPESNTPVWIYKIIGGGHDWPGSSGNMDFDASKVIWDFFEQFMDI
ncbi:MAG: prolyl oligopeptidase family serine peptidase [Bacteroidetes bacterium]|jgi:polyhydroxybutyrate depolymerase|nr:prolyl oligopeptidase family serine peptidase [Bacteroidota bacterium]MBT4398828.1 prolyl oligopeptidase family serine peptidase [Bacteroidota bacterium]